MSRQAEAYRNVFDKGIKMKKIIVPLAAVMLLWIFSVSVSAENSNIKAEEIYLEQYNASGVKETVETLPEETKEFLNSLNIDPENPFSLGDIEAENIFSLIWDFISSGGLAPIKTLTLLVGIIIIFAAGEGVSEKSLTPAFSLCFCFGCLTVIAQPVVGLITGVEAGIKSLTTFMLAFVPVYAGIITSSGQTLSGSGFSALLLLATEVISQFISYGFLPLVSGCMCLSVTGGVSPISGIARIPEFFKKIYLWVMGIATTLFLGVLSAQTSVTATADNLGLRTTKIMLSGAIPVMGPIISEALSTAKNSIGLLRSGAGIYGVLALILLVLPIVIELLLWRGTLMLGSAVAEVFGLSNMAVMLRSVDYTLAILLGSLIFVTLLFIISLAVVMG